MAIAFGAVVNTTTSSGQTTVSQTGPTVSGTNTLGVAVVMWQTNEAITGCTWGGSAMTLVGAYSQESGNRRGALFFIVNPASAATVTATRPTGTNGFAISTAYYTGVKQTGQPDSSATPSGGSATSFAASTTVVASGCWLISTARNPSAGSGAGAGTTARGDFATAAGPGFGDSNGTVGTGSQSMTWTTSPADVWNSVIFSIAPTATEVKTAEGLAIASVKTGEGLATASIKNWQGLA